MRTNIDLDDRLMADAMRATGLGSKKATVEEALRLLVHIHEQRKAIEALRGMGWEGDLDKMREDWPGPELI